jgi:hypothetical protein
MIPPTLGRKKQNGERYNKDFTGESEELRGRDD